MTAVTVSRGAGELVAHPEWSFANDAAGLKNKPVDLITSDDGLAEPADKLFAAISAEGNQRLLTAHLATDHAYSDKRIALETQILRGLEALPTP